MRHSRRSFLAITALAPFALGAAGTANAETVCYDPAKLSLSQKNTRRSLNYVEASGDPKKNCGNCAFFTGTNQGCGTCAMLSGNPVNAAGVCDSFAVKG